MAADFPTSLHDFSATYSDATAQATTHPGIHNALNEELAAVQTKVGVDSSAVNTTHDYKLSGVSDGDKAVSLTGTETLTNKTLTSPKVNENVAVTATASELNITDAGNTTEKVLNVQSKASVYLSTDQLNLVNTTPTKVALDTEQYDIGSDFDTTNNRFAAPVTGYYAVAGAVQFKNVVANKAYLAIIYVNEVAAREARVQSSSVAQVAANVYGIVYATSGQVIELYAQSNSGDNTVDIDSTSTRTYLDIHLLSV